LIRTGRGLRVLAVNKFFYVRGGCERYFFDLDGLLSTHGHEVRHLSMTHPRNRQSSDSELFVSNVDFAQDESVGQEIKKGLRVIYSREARRAMDRAVRETRPDVVHMHNIAHQLSPSIMLSLKSGGIPAVQTLHDYKLICPVYVLMRSGATCEACKDGHFYNAFTRGCHPGGRVSGFANTVEMYLHRSVLRSYDSVRFFICPSRFMLEKVRSFGVAEERLVHLPYFIPVDEYAPRTNRDGGYYVFSGRLSREKGLPTLMEAASKVPDMKLVVLGEGPLEGDLRGRYGSEPWVEFRGHVSGDELMQVVSGAAFAVVPSQWYENQPLTILESFVRRGFWWSRGIRKTLPRRSTGSGGTRTRRRRWGRGRGCWLRTSIARKVITGGSWKYTIGRCNEDSDGGPEGNPCHLRRH
jgi:glycosyltransferase involved in cell wall biosynthesis